MKLNLAVFLAAVAPIYSDSSDSLPLPDIEKEAKVETIAESDEHRTLKEVESPTNEGNIVTQDSDNNVFYQLQYKPKTTAPPYTPPPYYTPVPAPPYYPGPPMYPPPPAPCDCSVAQVLTGPEIAKFAVELFLPPVLHDEKVNTGFGARISVRAIVQQMLPPGMPMTPIFAYGDPSNPLSYHHPSGTIEALQNYVTEVTWCNELVRNPAVCACNPYDYHACSFLKHVVQDACGKVIIDQTLHWANPPRQCRDGRVKTDCYGVPKMVSEEYVGPIPFVPHVHGAHADDHSDGYTEAWWLPAASDIPFGYATVGSRFQTQRPQRPVRPVCFRPEGTSSSKSSKSGKGSKSGKSGKSSKGKGKSGYARRALRAHVSEVTASHTGVQYPGQEYPGQRSGYHPNHEYPGHTGGYHPGHEYPGHTGGYYPGSHSSSSDDDSYDDMRVYTRPGCATFIYTNDQPTAALWYHDHSLGLTRLNVYGMGAGFYIIRGPYNYESGLIYGRLPGPPPAFGLDPNQPQERRRIREIPLAIQDKTFYRNGKVFYPANRAYFEEVGNPGTCFDDNSPLDAAKFLPTGELHRIWNPEAIFNTIVVNGNTWPKLTVARERYRMRIVNACDSRFLNLYVAVGNSCGATQAEIQELAKIPMYVIGSDQSLLPYVTKVEMGQVQRLRKDPNPIAVMTEQSLLMGPAERYDVIIDMSEVTVGNEIRLCNSGPGVPFAGFPIPGEELAETVAPGTGNIMQIKIDDSMNNYYGDPSTPVDQIVLNANAPGGVPFHYYKNRDREVTLVEKVTDDDEPVAVLLGIDKNDETSGLLWEQCVTENPNLYAIEEWSIFNLSGDAHPVHIHLVKFQIVTRENIAPVSPDVALDAPVGSNEVSQDTLSSVSQKVSKAYEKYGHKHGLGVHFAPGIVAPQESGWKDTVIAYPMQVTKVRALFDKRGLYVWHCHVLSHEDNEMMRPMCVGSCGYDCNIPCCPNGPPPPRK